jgi:hypothetical protein
MRAMKMKILMIKMMNLNILEIEILMEVKMMNLNNFNNLIKMMMIKMKERVVILMILINLAILHGKYQQIKKY